MLQFASKTLVKYGGIMKKFIVLGLISMTVLFFSFAKDSENTDIQNKGEKPMSFKMVTMLEGLEIANNNPDSVIVDVRREGEYRSGHIPGAILLTMETINSETATQVLPDKNQMILIYCRSGRRSKIAAQSLLELGYTNLIEFGGILDYTGEIEK